MRYFFDTEFIENGFTIDLISIGIASEDGRTYYAESSEVDWSKASEWVVENVKPHLEGHMCLKSRSQIRDEVLAFIGQDDPEIWAYYADYDWVVLCWLFGSMVDLPKGWPMFCRDLKQLVGKYPVKKAELEHNALFDAIAIRDTYIEFMAQK